MLCYNNLVGRACCYTESFSVHYLLRFSKQCFHVDVYIVSFLFFEVTEGVNDSIKTGMHNMEFRHNAMQKIIQLIRETLNDHLVQSIELSKHRGNKNK